MLHTELLVGGQFLGGPCDQAVGKGQIRAPYDGHLVGTYAEGGWSEMDAAIRAATDAFDQWRWSDRRDRQELLRRIASLVRERADELVEILTHEVGKPVTFSQGEVTRLGITFELAADLLDEPEGESLPTNFDPRGAAYKLVVTRVPIGPILAITPYNWPYNLAAHKIAPALAAGNTVVLKPSSLAPLSSLTLSRLIHDAGCPEGVFNAVACDSRTAQRAAEDPRIKLVSFTGSEAVGWKLKAALPTKRVSLELGGQAPVIVMPDADLDWAVKRTVLGSNGYAGQICIAVQHALVHEDVYDDVRQRLIAATESCPHGDPTKPDTICGPLIDSDNAGRVLQWIDEAEQSGAQILAGGNRIGNVVEPTLMEKVPPTVKLGCQEVFGPVLTLSKVANMREAVERINSTDYGIHAGVFSSNEDDISTACRELEMSGVIVNDYPTLRFDNMPYGGVKKSGFGREGVRYTYDEMTDPKAVVTKEA